MYENAIMFGLIGGVALAIIGQIFSFLYARKKRKLQDNLIRNAAELVHRMDLLEHKINKQGVKKMDADVKKLGVYLSGKISEAKEEINEKLDSINERLEELEESSVPKEEISEESEEDGEGEEEEDFEDYKGERKVSFDEAMSEIEEIEDKEPSKKKKKDKKKK